MLNSLEVYKESGIRAAKAHNDRDHARYREENLYFGRMYALEKPEDKPLARQAYEEGYKSARRVPPVQYFR